MSLPLTVTFWSSRRSPRGRTKTGTWKGFVENILGKPLVMEAKERLPGWSPATFKGNRRAKDRVIDVHALVLDYDAGDTSLKDVARIFKGNLGAVHTTFSHTPRHPRLRLILPLSRPVNAAEYDQLWQYAQQRCLPHVVDAAARDASRFWFLPANRPGGVHELRALKGEPSARDLVLGILRSDLDTILGRYVASHRQEVVAAFETWWEKYRVTLTRIEEERDAAAEKLRGFLGGLGYGR